MCIEQQRVSSLFHDDWNQTYAAFRLECETYPTDSRGGYYTKKEFVHFQEEAAERFVEIIPEIDIPAIRLPSVITNRN